MLNYIPFVLIFEVFQYQTIQINVGIIKDVNHSLIRFIIKNKRVLVEFLKRYSKKPYYSFDEKRRRYLIFSVRNPAKLPK